MKKERMKLVVFCLLIGISLGCRKAKLNRATTTSEDNALSETLFEDVYNQIDEALSSEEGVNKMEDGLAGGCATVSISALDTVYPKTVTIDFGTSNCEGNDGRTRRGKIIVNITGPYRTVGTKITTTFENYFVNDYQIEGTKVVEHTAERSFKIEVSDAKITFPNGADKITWESSRNRVWSEGFNTKISLDPADSACFLNVECLLDDVYEITGSATGTNRDGRLFDVDIKTPLRIEFCGYIPEVTEGTIEIQPEDLKLRTINYGSGDCDNQASVKIGKKTKTFSLRK